MCSFLFSYNRIHEWKIVRKLSHACPPKNLKKQNKTKQTKPKQQAIEHQGIHLNKSLTENFTFGSD